MVKNKSKSPVYTLNCGGQLLTLHTPLVMGILNVTPDSFYAGSRVAGIDEIVARAGQMLADGAAMLDVGGQSTRPGSERVSAETEAARVVEPIRAIKAAFPDAVISIDTYYAAVAEKAVQAGATVVNDVSGGQLDRDMLRTVGALGLPYVCMHMKGSPETMQQHAHYNNLLQELTDYFIERLAACHAAGIKDVMVDPGIGFGKSMAHNFELLQQLHVLHILQRPLLIGLSRKSFIWKSLNITAAEALNGTTVMNTVALLQGAQILRVHDVREAVEAVRLLQVAEL